MITDPPYCILTRRRKLGDERDPKKRRKIDDEPAVPKFESVREYEEFTKKWLHCAHSVLTKNATLVIWTNFLGKVPKCPKPAQSINRINHTTMLLRLP